MNHAETQGCSGGGREAFSRQPLFLRASVLPREPVRATVAEPSQESFLENHERACQHPRSLPHMCRPFFSLVAPLR